MENSHSDLTFCSDITTAFAEVWEVVQSLQSLIFVHKQDWLESLRPLRPSIKNTSAKLFSETVQGLVHGDGNEEGHETHKKQQL